MSNDAPVYYSLRPGPGHQEAERAWFAVKRGRGDFWWLHSEVGASVRMEALSRDRVVKQIEHMHRHPDWGLRFETGPREPEGAVVAGDGVSPEMAAAWKDDSRASWKARAERNNAEAARLANGHSAMEIARMIADYPPARMRPQSPTAKVPWRLISALRIALAREGGKES